MAHPPKALSHSQAAAATQPLAARTGSQSALLADRGIHTELIARGMDGRLDRARTPAAAVVDVDVAVPIALAAAAGVVVAAVTAAGGGWRWGGRGAAPGAGAAAVGVALGRATPSCVIPGWAPRFNWRWVAPAIGRAVPTLL